MVQICGVGRKRSKQILKLEKGDLKMNEQTTKYKDYKVEKPVRETHCFNCKEDINSQQWEVCDSCKGIVCSCGSCFCSWGE